MVDVGFVCVAVWLMSLFWVELLLVVLMLTAAALLTVLMLDVVTVFGITKLSVSANRRDGGVAGIANELCVNNNFCLLALELNDL